MGKKTMGIAPALYVKNVKQVLKQTKKVIRHHEELSRAKGEHFNVFSVLDMESNENKTHSAFLTELLDPKGSHLLGDVFLQLFLEVVNPIVGGVEQKSFQEYFNASNQTYVKSEYFIGQRDDKNKTGGRIDIFIKQGAQTICLENKIYATDQNAQIERYCNYNFSNNTVFYLTLFGEDPSKDSKGNLEESKHFYNLSYQEEILHWLELCLKEAVNYPSLREAINQYILLIKKLTNTLNMTAEKELFEVMIDNMEAAKTIAKNYEKLANKIRDKFRRDVVSHLKEKLVEKKYKIEEDKPIDATYAKILITYDGSVNHSLKYGIGSFSGKGHKPNKLFVGVLGREPLPKTFDQKKLNYFNKDWQHAIFIENNEKALNLNDSNLLRRIYDIREYNELLMDTVNQIKEFICDTEEQLGFK